MFVVKTNQISALRLSEFEMEMVAHVREFFPNHFFSMQETGTRNTIQYGYLNAKKYGFNTQRNVCLYLNNMLVLGSNFDIDPQYPWAIEILNDKKEKDPRQRADKLTDKMLNIFGRITGPREIDINYALHNLNNNSADIFQNIMNSQLKDVLPFLKTQYPKKYEVIGESNLNQLMKMAKAKVIDYGITSEPNIVMFIMFMFLCGAGFDKDPQFPWAFRILSDLELKDENQKSKLLFDKAINNLGLFLTQYKYK